MAVVKRISTKNPKDFMSGISLGFQLAKIAPNMATRFTYRGVVVVVGEDDELELEQLASNEIAKWEGEVKKQLIIDSLALRRPRKTIIVQCPGCGQQLSAVESGKFDPHKNEYTGKWLYFTCEKCGNHYRGQALSQNLSSPPPRD